MSNPQAGYPGGQPAPPPRSRAVVITVAIVVVVIGLVARIAAEAIWARTDDPAGRPPAAQPTVQPTTLSSGPVLCRPRSIATCFPRATTASVSAVLESRGAACRQVGAWTTICHQGEGPNSIDLALDGVPGHPDKIDSFHATTRSADAKGRVLVERNLRAWLPTVLAALLPGEPKTQRRLAQWIPKDLSWCPSPGAASVAGYRVDCQIPALKDEFGRPSTSWTTGVTIYPDY